MIYARQTYANPDNYIYGYDEDSFSLHCYGLSNLIELAQSENEPITFCSREPKPAPRFDNYIYPDTNGDLEICYRAPGDKIPDDHWAFPRNPVRVEPEEIMAFARNRDKIVRDLRELGLSKKISAIKLYRHIFGAGLSEAKAQIETPISY